MASVTNEWGSVEWYWQRSLCHCHFFRVERHGPWLVTCRACGRKPSLVLWVTFVHKADIWTRDLSDLNQDCRPCHHDTCAVPCRAVVIFGLLIQASLCAYIILLNIKCRPIFVYTHYFTEVLYVLNYPLNHVNVCIPFSKLFNMEIVIIFGLRGSIRKIFR